MTTPALHVVRKGQGDPVLLLHSGGMSSRQWRRLQDRLAVSYEVLAPDFLGSGANPPWPAGTPFHFQQDVDAVRALVEPLDRPFHVVGHSYGGLVALTLARQLPERIRSVAVYDPVAFGVIRDAQDAEGLADLARSDQLRDPASGGTEAWMEQFIDYWSGPGAFQSFPPESRAAFVRVAPKVFLEVASLATDPTRLADYAALTAPVLLLAGETSPPAARRVTALLEGALPRVRRVVVEGAGHMGPITHGERVAELIEQHIGA